MAMNGDLLGWGCILCNEQGPDCGATRVPVIEPELYLESNGKPSVGLQVAK